VFKLSSLTYPFSFFWPTRKLPVHVLTVGDIRRQVDWQQSIHAARTQKP
jgi:hypothetical protein